MRQQVLVVDDEFINRQILGNIMQTEYDILYAENGKEALDTIMAKREMLSLVMLDLIMPIMDGFELLKILKADETLSDLPVIVLTADSTAEVKSLHLGAADFIKKPYDMPEVVLARAKRIIELSEKSKMIETAETDSLTGLYTAHFFFERVRRQEAFYPDRATDAVALEINHFDLVNELYGKEYGERLLIRIADKFRQILTDEDIACRVEGSLFYICCAHREDYESLASELLMGVEELSGNPWIKVQIGVFADREKDTNLRFFRAKFALEEAKKDYDKDSVCFDEDLLESVLYIETILNDISGAIEREELEVYYQPKYDITGETPVLCGAETLLRWNHPDLGFLRPAKFVPLIERNEIMRSVDYYVCQNAAKALRNWKDHIGLSIPISVNLSRIDFYDAFLEDKLLGIMQDNALSPREFVLEISETAYAEDPLQVVERVRSMKAKGFKFELDNYYTDYSSLNMLSMLPIDVLKFNLRSFYNAFTDEQFQHIANIAAEVGRYLSVSVAAEGVERENQFRIVKNSGFEVAQGFYFSKPMRADEIEELLREQK